MLAALRSRLGVYGITALIVVVITIGAIAVYSIYGATVGKAPLKAITTYLDTANSGDMAKLYDLTLGAGSQTQAEFANQLGAVFANSRISVDMASIEAISHQGGTNYYRATAKVTTPDGSYRMIPLLVAAAPEGKEWHVAVFLPPAALPTGQ